MLDFTMKKPDAIHHSLFAGDWKGRNKADLKLSSNSEETAKISMTMDDAHNLDCLNRPFVCIRVRFVENQVHSFD